MNFTDSIDICGNNFVAFESYAAWKGISLNSARDWAASMYKSVVIGGMICESLIPLNDSCVRCLNLQRTIGSPSFTPDENETIPIGVSSDADTFVQFWSNAGQMRISIGLVPSERVSGVIVPYPPPKILLLSSTAIVPNEVI